MAKPTMYAIVFNRWLEVKAVKQRTPLRVLLHPFHFAQLMAEVTPLDRDKEEIEIWDIQPIEGETFISSSLGPIRVAPDYKCTMEIMYVEYLPPRPVQIKLALEGV